MKAILLAIGLTIIFSNLALAQVKDVPPSGSLNTSTTTVTTSPGILSNPSLYTGIKSYNVSGRPQELNTPGQREFRSKNEYYLGFKSQAGYGVFGQGVEYVHQFSDAPTGAKNPNVSNVKAGDPSISFMHPIYSDDRLSLNGLAREYFPVTTRATTQGIYQQAYYLTLLYKAHGGYDLFNQLVPRYFSQMTYKPTDSVFYTEDWTKVSKNLKPWFRLGAGQHYQIETHSGIPTGQTLEVFPYADFMFSNNVYFGPRLYFPVAVQNYVYDAPTAVSANNIQAELYFQATL